MASRKSFTNSFAGGEMSPLMQGHIEDEGYRTGFARGRNMLVLPTGAATKRPQFDFVRACKSGASPVRLFPFVYGDGDAYAMEWGTNHVRFHGDGTTLLYATPIPVASVDLSADTFTTTSAHGLSVNAAVRITHKGTSIPGNLATGSTYYVRDVVSTTSFTLSASAGPGALLDLTTNSTIDETSFWRQSELPREYITSKNIASVNAGADSVNVVGHSLVAGDAVKLTSSLTFTADAGTDDCTSVAHGIATGVTITLSSSGTLPGGLSAGVTYYVTSLTADTFELRTDPSAISPIDITDAGIGTHTATILTVLASTPSVAAGTVYYVSIVDADNFRLHATKAEALAVAGTIDLTGIGGGTPRLHFAYYQGDIVWGGSLTILASTSSRLFITIEDLTTALPTVADWYQMPADGVYELYTTIGAAALASLGYDQSYDVWTLVKPQSRAFTLGREGAEFPSGSSATADVVRWVFRAVDPSPSPPAPTLSLTTRVFGEYYNVTIANLSFSFAASGTTNHGLIPGDVVYLEGSIGAGTAIADVAGTPGFFIVTTTATNTFQLRAITTGSAEVQNTNAVSSRSGAIRVAGSSSKLTESYVVTALRDGDESLASNVVDVTNNLQVPGSSNVLGWTAVTEATRYRIYKKLDEAYGLLAETALLTFTDDGIGPDLAFQPPDYDDSLTTEYPSATAFFQQRPWFGGTDTNPRRVWGGKTGTVSVMSYHERLLLATDRIRFDVAARERTLVRHIVPASQLWLLTSSAEIRVTGVNSDVLTPTSIDARPLSHIGCTIVRPIVANSNILFVGARDQHVYELPSQTYQIVDPPDLSVRSAHLFDGYTMAQSAQQRAPVPIEWYVRNDGSLLGMTYMPAQNIRGWHVHTAAGTAAAIQSVCVIPDSDGDRLYAVVSRTINSATVLHIERMGRIETPATMTACKFLDSCVTYSGTAATSIPVPHLPGQVVYAVADGVVRGPFTVTTGAAPTITLTTAASTVHVGLLYLPELRPMPPAVLIDGFGKGRELNVNHVSLRVESSCGFKVAAYQDDDAERGIVRTPWAVPGLDNTRMRNKDVEASVDGSWGRAQVVITQDVPLPLTIVSMTIDVEVGGP